MLERLISSNGLDNRNLFDAMLYRAHAYRILNSARARDGWPVDKAGAQRAMDDFAILLKIAEDNGFPAAWIANTEYAAGSVALNHLKDEALAYTYWRRCSDREHAGCMNVIAHAAFDGAAGQTIDHQLALTLHKKIHATGTQFTCAGAFSGMSVFKMTYFLGLDAGEASGIWIERSIDLLNRIAERQNGLDPCNRAIFELYDYVFKLSQGDRQEATLRAVLRRKQVADIRAIAEYMLSGGSEVALMTTMRGNSSGECTTHFLMMWYGQVIKQRDLADAHYNTLKKTSACASEIAFASKYYR
jgi:hypothetical protein